MTARIGWRALARYFAGESPPEEAATIENWKAADRKHADIFDSARRAWSSAEPNGPTFDADRAWAALSSRIAAAEPLTPTRTRRRSVLWASGLMAAAIAFAIIVPLMRSGPDADSYESYVTGAGEFKTIALGDGSVVRLAPNSTLRTGLNGAREAWLDGTGFFAIAKRDGERFVVHTRSGDAQVLGTRFELSAGERGVRLVVFEGRVALTAKGAREVVEAGQSSSVDRGRTPTAPARVAVARMDEWIKGVLIFQTTPLSDVAREIERQYGVRVILSDAALAGRTISAVFDHQPLPTVVAAVCRVVDARCAIQDSTVSIQP